MQQHLEPLYAAWYHQSYEIFTAICLQKKPLTLYCWQLLNHWLVGIKDESVKGNNSAHTAELSPQKYAARTILTAYLAKQESGFSIYHQNSSCTFIVFNHSNQFIWAESYVRHLSCLTWSRWHVANTLWIWLHQCCCCEETVCAVGSATKSCFSPPRSFFWWND